MSLFQRYLAESYVDHKYRIKTAFQLNEKQIKILESVLQKYDLKDFSGPRETPLQKNPLDFPNIKNANIFIIDVVLGMPTTNQVLINQIAEALEITSGFFVVRSEHDPIECYTEQLNDESEYQTKMSTDPNYNKNESVEAEVYGDQYNQKLLSRLAKAKLEIDGAVTEDKAQFNSKMPGVKPHYGKASTEKPTSKYGNFVNPGAKK